MTEAASVPAPEKLGLCDAAAEAVVAGYDGRRLLSRLAELGGIGRTPAGGRTRLALTEADGLGRDRLAGWLREAGLAVTIDEVGNIFGTLPGAPAGAPVVLGSHIDTVPDAGALDGCLGVLAALEALAAIRAAGFVPTVPLVVAAFTNEEGVRFTPDLLGSRVAAGELRAAVALAAGTGEGATVADDLRRIGHDGGARPFDRPAAYLELHIEQGPVLEAAGVPLGIVEGIQGSRWLEVEVVGQAAHAGATPMRLRRDAGAAAAAMVVAARDAALAGCPSVATVGRLVLEPGASNVIAARATFIADLRDPEPAELQRGEARFRAAVAAIAAEHGVAARVACISRTEPVRFDPGLVALCEAAARATGAKTRRLISGASHDAQSFAPVCPTAMIFVPSIGGVSHTPEEATAPEHILLGALALLRAALALAGPLAPATSSPATA